MLLIANPTYTLRVEISDKLRSAITISDGATGAVTSTPHKPYQFFGQSTVGCDDVLAAVRDALTKAGIENATVTFERFEYKP